jgi:hypothetical protein
LKAVSNCADPDVDIEEEPNEEDEETVESGWIF